MACGDASKIFEATEGIFDAVAQLVGIAIEAERLLPIGLVWNNGFCPAILESLAQFGAVIGFVCEELFCRFCPSDQKLCRRAIMVPAAGQKDGKKTALSICDCVDFRVAPAARAANCLLEFPLFPPEAER